MASSERAIPMARVTAPPPLTPVPAAPRVREVAIVVCRHCGDVFRTDARHAGQWSRCPSCGQALQITIAGVVSLPDRAPPEAPWPAAHEAVEASAAPPSHLAAPDVSLPPPPASSGALPPLTYRPPPLPQRLVESVEQAQQTLRPGSPAKSGRKILALLGAGLCLLAAVMMILVALVTAVVPSPNPDFAEQRWSGVMCALLTAAAFGLPGVWLLRRGL